MCACHVAVVGLDDGLLCAACDRLFHIGRKIVIAMKHITLEDFCQRSLPTLVFMKEAMGR